MKSNSSRSCIERKDRDIAWRDAKIEKINFELARLKRWKFGAKTEAMTAEQRADVPGHAAGGRGQPARPNSPSCKRRCPRRTQARRRQPPRRPRRQALPEHLRRVEHHHEPEDTTCPTARLRPADDAHRRGHQRTAGHRAGRVLRAPPHLRQVGLPLLPARICAAGAGRAARSSTAASPPAGWWRTR